MVYLNCDFLFLHSLFDNCISFKLFPHFLEGWIFFDFILIIGPFHFIFVLCIVQHIPPIFLLKFVLDLLDILVGVVKDVNSLYKQRLTSRLICCISTSSNFVLTSFSLTSPFSIIFCRSFFALRRGTSSFLFPVYLKAGTFSAIFASISATSLFLALMKFLMVSLAFLSLNFTSSTFSSCGFF